MNVWFNRFSFKVNLVLEHPRSTNLLFGPLTYEPNTSLGSLQIESLHILLNIFYSLSFYRRMQAILISSHYLMNMISLILH